MITKFSKRSDDMPLSGLTVVSIEHAIAGPFATRQLADLGARVIKVERPKVGDFARAYDHRVEGLASHFVWTNRSKESLSLDLKDEEGLEVLKRLLKSADVFVQNLAPGAAARLGLSYEMLSEENPKLIVCDISGYGESGPYSDKKAYDLLVQSESGFLSVTGTADEEVKAGISIADIATGMYAYTNILAAIIQRTKTGVGRRIEISMLESMVEWMNFPLYYAYKDQTAPSRSGASHATIYPYGAFMANDGHRVILGLQNEREWATFCDKVLVLPELKLDPKFCSNALRSENRAELKNKIDKIFSKISSEEIVARLESAGIANAKVNSMADVWSHKQLAARERWVTINTPSGPVPALIPPGTDQTNPAFMGDVPSVGEHTESILRELGMDNCISAFKEKGVI